MLGLGFGVLGLGFGSGVLRLRVSEFGPQVQGLRPTASGLGFKAEC